MDGELSASHSASHENPHDGYSPRRSPNIWPDDDRHKSSRGAKNENRAPMSPQIALNSMLKTTTETGDIGQFAIKPSRLPPPRKPISTGSDYTLQRPQQTFQLPDGQQAVDHRRRLPSYARDATSEIFSLYETASQKACGSPRVLETTDHRSYSMAQTSYPSSALSNHRSYTSLRSQPELGLLPHSRSPFFYPARMKRLGFRPSSPILTEGGRVDSGQNLELERSPYVSNPIYVALFSPSSNSADMVSEAPRFVPLLPYLGDHASDPVIEAKNVSCISADAFEQTGGTSTRSASPLNTYNKRPPIPLILLSDSNSTYPPPLGRLPSGSRSYSPSLRSTTDSTQDWSFRPEPVLTKASPPGSNFRSTSTPVNYHRRSPNSFTGTTSKSHTPSPLYYDYTEDFNVEEAGAEDSAVGDAPSIVRFILDNTIHEGRRVATEASPKSDSSPRGSPTSVDLRALVTVSNDGSLELSDDKPRLNSEDGQTERSTNVTQDIIPLYLDRRPYDRIVGNPFDNKNFPVSNQFESALDGSLPSKGDANDGLSPILLDAVDKTNHGLNTSQSLDNKESRDQENTTERISSSNRTSSFRLSTYLPIFPKPADWTIQMITDGGSKARSQEELATLPVDAISVQKPGEYAIQAANEGLCYGHQESFNHLPTGTSRQFQLDLPTTTIQRSATTHDRRIRSSRYYSIDHGLTDLAQLISNFEFANGSFISQDVHTHFAEATTRLSVQPSSTLPTSGMSKESLALPTKALLQLSSPQESHTPLIMFRSDGNLRVSSSQPYQTSNYALHDQFINLDNYGKERVEAVYYSNNASRSISRRPLSRSEPPLLAPKAVSPARVLRLKNSVPQLMKALPPVPRNPILEGSSPQRSSRRHLPFIFPQTDLAHRRTSVDVEPIQVEAAVFQSIPSQQDLEDVIKVEQTFPAPLKFRIKSRFFNAQRSRSPANSRPWNLDESYPWYGQQSTIRLSSLRSMIPGAQRGPKFKLRVTRASTSPSGTIRINPDARSSLDLRSPKDLFTSSSNLSGIFRQVSRQFSSRKSSAVLEIAPGNGSQAPFMVLASTQSNGNHGDNPDLLGPQSSPKAAYPTSPTEVRSFFSEDSSQIRGHNSLRKRISNLRARIPNPYTSRPAANLNDNEAWRGHIAPYAPPKGRLGANINSEQEDEYGMPIASLRHQKLRSKVSGWFKDAGLAMKRYVKLRNGADVPCIPFR